MSTVDREIGPKGYDPRNCVLGRSRDEDYIHWPSGGGWMELRPSYSTQINADGSWQMRRHLGHFSEVIAQGVCMAPVWEAEDSDMWIASTHRPAHD